jgi:hypothetical protein
LERVELALLQVVLAVLARAARETILCLPQLPHWVVVPVYLDLPTAEMVVQAAAVVIVTT